jgi:hypothetical protein
MTLTKNTMNYIILHYNKIKGAAILTSSASRPEPRLVMADENGNIYDDPRLLVVCRRGAQWGLPRPDELMPLPEESELFLLRVLTYG